MELIRGIHNIRDKHHGCVLTIGKFDGVHLGHQAVLKQVLLQASRLNLPAIVMVFEPQPEELFTPEYAPARLSLLRDKYKYLQEVGVHKLLCVRFSRAFASMSPTQFVQDFLVDKLGVKFLVVGDDFRFGFNRVGDFEFLQKAGSEKGFQVVSTQSFRMAEHRISSTAIRNALYINDFEQANAMLGRPFVISGKVVHGEKNGRKIGYPTANILLNRHKSPLSGVFAIKVKLIGNLYKGVANIGKRPTLNGSRMQLEVNIFEYNGDLYGKFLEVEFIAKIRDEIKFSDLQTLKQQILKDAEQARQLLAN